MDLEEQRAVIDSVVDHFVVQAAPRVRNRFTSQRLTPARVNSAIPASARRGAQTG